MNERRHEGTEARRHEETAGLRLAIWVIAVVGAVCFVWLIGYIGFRLGFAPLIDVPDLRIDPCGGLVTGMAMLLSVPMVIIRAGEAKPTWLILAFALIAIPAAGLGAARPRDPSQERPSSAAVAFTYAGAIGAALNALALIWWTASETRTGRIDQLRIDTRETAWIEDLVTVAGMDVLAVIAATLWVVLVMRLAIPTWLRALSATAAIFALAVATVAMSISNASATELRRPRSEVFLDDGSIQTRLVVGTTPAHVATLRIEQNVAVIELHERTGTMTVVGRESIAGLLRRGRRGRGS